MALSYEVKFLPNRTTLTAIKNPGLNTFVVFVGIRVGSRYEKLGTYGVAHFLEHMFFKGTRKHPNSKLLASVIDSKGGEHNAFTDKDRTIFYIQMASPFAETAINLAHEMLANPLLLNRDILRERSVIQEEITMYENDPDQKASMLSDQFFYTDPGMGHPITGSVTDVEFTPLTVKKFFKAYYVPSRTTVVLAGNFDSKIFDLAARKFGSIDGEFTGEEYQKTESHISYEFKSANTDKMHLLFRLPTAKLWTHESRKIHLLSMILGGYGSSRLFQSLREKKGLCYSIDSSPLEYSDIGSLLIRTIVDVPKFDATVVGVMKEVTSIAKSGVTRPELEAAKTCLKGMTLSVMDHPMSIAESIAHQMSELHAFETLDERLASYLRFSVDHINEAARKYMDPSKLSLTVVGPASSQKIAERFLKQLRA